MLEPNEEVRKLNKNLEALSERFREAYSLKRVFMRGLVTGIGTVIGASIVAALILTLLFQFFGLIGIRSTIERLLSPEVLEASR